MRTTVTPFVGTMAAQAVTASVQRVFDEVRASLEQWMRDGHAGAEAPDACCPPAFAVLETGSASTRVSGAGRNGHATPPDDVAIHGGGRFGASVSRQQPQARGALTNSFWSHFAPDAVGVKAPLCGSLFRFTASDGQQALLGRDGWFALDGTFTSVAALGSRGQLALARRSDGEVFVLRNDGSLLLRGPYPKGSLLGECEQFLLVQDADGASELYRTADGAPAIQGVDGEVLGSIRLQGRGDRYIEAETRLPGAESVRKLFYAANGTPVLFAGRRAPGERYEMIAGGDYIKVVSEAHAHERLYRPNGKFVLDAAFDRIDVMGTGETHVFLGRGLRTPVGRASSLLRRSKTDLVFRADGTVLARGKRLSLGVLRGRNLPVVAWPGGYQLIGSEEGTR